jgi:hypothetical protein
VTHQQRRDHADTFAFRLFDRMTQVNPHKLLRCDTPSSRTAIDMGGRRSMYPIRITEAAPLRLVPTSLLAVTAFFRQPGCYGRFRYDA